MNCLFRFRFIKITDAECLSSMNSKWHKVCTLWRRISESNNETNTKADLKVIKCNPHYVFHQKIKTKNKIIATLNTLHDRKQFTHFSYLHHQKLNLFNWRRKRINFNKCKSLNQNKRRNIKKHQFNCALYGWSNLISVDSIQFVNYLKHLMQNTIWTMVQKSK